MLVESSVDVNKSSNMYLYSAQKMKVENTTNEHRTWRENYL